jgi:phosphinothricin acetyltransferase
MRIRPAEPADLPEIQAVYAHHVLHGTASFEEEPPALEAMTERWQEVVRRGWSWLVATDATGVLGYAYFHQFHPRSAYRYSTEDSIYVRDDMRGRGVGKALLARLLADAEACGLRQMIAVIGDADNAGSIALHASLGFRHAGALRSVGFKFGRWLDSIHMQRPLGAGDRTLPG